MIEEKACQSHIAKIRSSFSPRVNGRPFSLKIGAPGKAWEEGMRQRAFETSHENPVGNQSHPAKACHQPEPSVASHRGDPVGEAYTGIGQSA